MPVIPEDPIPVVITPDNKCQRDSLCIEPTVTIGSSSGGQSDKVDIYRSPSVSPVDGVCSSNTSINLDAIADVNLLLDNGWEKIKSNVGGTNFKLGSDLVGDKVGCYVYVAVTDNGSGAVAFSALSSSEGVLIDRVKPNISSSTIEQAFVVADENNLQVAKDGSTFEFTLHVSDQGSGISSVKMRIDGVDDTGLLPCSSNSSVTGEWICIINMTNPVNMLSDGAHTVSFVVSDRYGNKISAGVNNSNATSFIVDNIAPKIRSTSVGTQDAGIGVFVEGKKYYFNPSYPGILEVNGEAEFDNTFGSNGSSIDIEMPIGWSVVPDIVPAQGGTPNPMKKVGASPSPIAHPSNIGHKNQKVTWSADAIGGSIYIYARESIGAGANSSPIVGPQRRESVERFDLVQDTDPPSGTTIDVDTSSTYPKIVVQLGKDNKGGSGVSHARIQRRSAQITAHSTCAIDEKTFEDLDKAQDVKSVFEDKGVEALQCYQYRVVTSDNVNNEDPGVAFAKTIFVGDMAVPADPVDTVKEDPVRETKVKEKPVVPVSDTPTPTKKPQKEVDKPNEETRAPIQQEEVKEEVEENKDRYYEASGTTNTPPVNEQPAPIMTTEHERSMPMNNQQPRNDKEVKKEKSSMGEKAWGWAKKHPLGALGAGLIGGHIGSSLLFGKGIGVLFAKLNALSGGHLSVPLRPARSGWNWIINRFGLKKRRRRNMQAVDEDDFDDYDSYRNAA